jgi:dTDP-4-amino-4,6-dideoxygalactose transaminase
MRGNETKNIQCGEGGMLIINDEQFVTRAEIIWEKGTNRSAFWRGEKGRG